MDTIIEKLDSLGLSALEKRRLRDALDLELTGSKGDYTEIEQAVWNAVTQVLHIRLPLDKFLARTKYGKRAYSNDAFQVEQYVKENCGDLRRNERMAVLATIMRCMVLYLTDGDSDRLSPQRLLENIYLVDQAVEDQYPGYGDAGLLRRALINAPR